MSKDPLDTLIAGPEGGSRAVTGYVGYGCPTYSVGPDANMVELILVEAGSVVLKWLQEVALDQDYVNPRVHIFFPEEEEDDGFWRDEDFAQAQEEETKEEADEEKDRKEEAKKVMLRVERDTPLPPRKDEPEGIDEEIAKEMAKQTLKADGDAGSEDES